MRIWQHCTEINFVNLCIRKEAYCSASNQRNSKDETSLEFTEIDAKPNRIRKGRQRGRGREERSGTWDKEKAIQTVSLFPNL